MEQEALEEGLRDIDQSILFLVAIIAGVFLSFRALLAQRDGLCAQLEGETPDLSCLYPLRHTGNGLVVGALGFFLCLSAKTAAQADPDDPVAIHSSRSNLIAAVLVFLAAALRFDDVNFLRSQGRL